jgi:hypothetical protein
MRRTTSEKAAFTEGALMGMFLFGAYVIVVAAAGGAAPWVIPLGAFVGLMALLLVARA